MKLKPRAGLTVADIARVCHEANRAYCEVLGDGSQMVWELAPAWQQESAMDGVQLILADGERTPRQAHENWCERKRGDGWTFAPMKNPEAKEHPCLVPYDELPAPQRAKDALFIAVVRALSEEA